MVLRTLVAITAIALVSLVTPSDAQAQRYGAIAYSPATGAHGWAYSHPSRRSAGRRALRGCRQYAGDCRVVVWTRNTCAALAIGRGNAAGWAWNTSLRRAQRNALRQCRARAGGCVVRRWICN
jgi:hypothetical protein